MATNEQRVGVVMDDVEKRARRPVSYDAGTCEGWQTSPSNPTKSRKKSQPKKSCVAERRELDAVVVFRCTVHEKATLIDKAKHAGLPFAVLMREALGLVDSRRRKPVPTVNAELLRSVARIGSNINQIARQLNVATRSGHVDDIDALIVAARLLACERSLNELIAQSSSRGDH